MTRLSSIPQAPDAAETEMLVGVEADIPDFNPPSGLKRIAFIARMDGDSLDETLLDALIGSTMAGLDTIIEVPADADIDPSFLMTLAANLNASVSLLPPDRGEADEAAWRAARERWFRRNEDFARTLLASESFNRYLHPVSSFLEFMFAEVLHSIEAMKPNDPYVVARFADVVDQETIDELKERLRAAIHDAAGGEENFRSFAQAVFRRIHLMADNNASDIADKAREDMARKAVDS